MNRGAGAEPSRRQLLAAGGAAITGLAGCTSSGDRRREGPRERPKQQASTTPSAPEDGALLEDLSIVNFDDRNRTFHLLVEHDGETVHWASHDASAAAEDGSRRSIEAEIPRQAGDLTVRARVDEERAIAEIDDADGVCVGIQVVYDPTAGGKPLDIYRSTRECPNRFAGSE